MAKVGRAAKEQGRLRGSTPATVALTRLGISFEVRSYPHDPAITDFGREAAQALGVCAERVFKTLMVDADGSLMVGMVPVDRLLNLKALAAAVGARKVALADPALAERKTGYVVGGISPIGQRTQLHVVLDASAMEFDTVLVSGGRRGFEIELAPQDLLRATQGEICEIARP